MQGWFNIRKSVNVIHLFADTEKAFNHLNTGKAFDQIQHPFMMNSQQTGNSNVLNLIKGVYKKPIANIILNGKKLNALPLGWQQGKHASILTTPIQHHTGGSSWYSMARK